MTYRFDILVEWKVHDVFHEMLLRYYPEDLNPGRQQNTRNRLATADPQGALVDETFQPIKNPQPYTGSQDLTADARQTHKRQRISRD
jgi:hypothetical protein